MSALDEAICYHSLPQSRCEHCGEVCKHCGEPWTIRLHQDGRHYLHCERLEQEHAERGRAMHRQAGEAGHALRMEFYDLALSHLYDDERPPAPFSLAIVGYTPTREQARLALEGTTQDDRRWTVRFDRSQRAVFREIDPDVAAKLPYHLFYTDGAEPPDAPRQEQPDHLLPGPSRAHHLVRAYAKERPDVGIWVVIEAEHTDTVSTVRGWVLDWHESPPPPPGLEVHFRVEGTGSTATAPERTGAWADIFPRPEPAGALARHPGPWRENRAPVVSGMPFQIVRRAMLSTAQTSEWATVNNVAVYRSDDHKHGNRLEVQRRCDAATPDAIFAELVEVAGDAVGDTYAATVTRIIDASAPAEGIWVNVHDILHDRGLAPITRQSDRYSHGYRTEDRIAVGEHFEELKRWHVTGQLTTWQSTRGKKPSTFNIHSDLLTYTDMVTQTATDGREVPIAVRVVLGEYARYYLANGAGRQTAMLMRQALRYDPRNEQIEKRLTYHLAFYWREAAHDRSYLQPLLISRLFQDARIETEGKTQRQNPARSIRRWVQAFDTLKANEVIAGYTLLPPADDKAKARSQLDRWLAQRVKFTPPAWVPQQYLDLGKHNPRLRAKS